MLSRSTVESILLASHEDLKEWTISRPWRGLPRCPWVHRNNLDDSRVVRQYVSKLAGNEDPEISEISLDNSHVPKQLNSPLGSPS